MKTSSGFYINVDLKGIKTYFPFTSIMKRKLYELDGNDENVNKRNVQSIFEFEHKIAYRNEGNLSVAT